MYSTFYSIVVFHYQFISRNKVLFDYYVFNENLFYDYC